MDLAAVADACRAIATEIAAPAAADVDAAGRWPEATLRALQRQGLGGLVVPREHGGLGHGLQGLARACEELGRGCTSSALCFGMHCVGSAVLAAKATPLHVERYLAPIVRGEHLTTLALSEAGTGVHFYFPQCACLDDADGNLLVSGSKSFVTNGSQADSYVVSVQRTDLDPLTNGRFSCVVADADVSGLSWGPAWDGLGLRGNSSRDLILEDVRLSADQLLGAEGDQLWYVFQVVAPYFVVAMAGTYLGVAQAAFDLCRDAIVGRHFAHSGRGLAGSSVVQHRVGSLWASIERSRCLLRNAAASYDRGDEGALPAVLSCKAEISDCANTVVAEAMTLMGGRAYRSSSALHRLLRDARAAHIMSPTTELLRLWVGRLLLGLPLLGD